MKDNYVHPRKTDLGESPGMELRDWFAGMAMQGKMAGDPEYVKPLDAAITAYKYADAMMEVREKELKK